MSKREEEKILRKAYKAGVDYASKQLESEHFEDYVSENLYRASVEDLPETKKQAMPVARNFLADLWNDTRRDMLQSYVLKKIGGLGYETRDKYDKGYVEDRDAEEAFWKGFGDRLDRKGVQGWLADEILFRSKERRGEA